MVNSGNRIYARRGRENKLKMENFTCCLVYVVCSVRLNAIIL